VNQWGLVFLAGLGLGPVVGCADSPRYPCENPTPQEIDGEDVGIAECDNGVIARVAAKSCRIIARPDYECPRTDAERVSPCRTDADCSDILHGRCNAGPYFGPTPCVCERGCAEDSDCQPDQVCECGSGVGQCVPANCRTSADCANGECARYTYKQCIDGEALIGYACQTPADTCATNDECPDETGGCGIVDGHRECTGELCGIGRPFLVNNTARVATPTSRDDWRAGPLPNLSGLSNIDRADLATWWLDAALMEHASVAAFARFTLELMSLGAPPELVQDATRAMSDETRHAKVCFALASTYRGQALGPAKLAIDGALQVATPRAIVAATIREGCIGETLAALEAALAAERATDPVIVQTLKTIHADEGRHAALAWRFIRWALENGHITANELEAEFESAVADTETHPTSTERASDPGRQHGILDRGSRAALRTAALEGVIRPALTRTVATAQDEDDHTNASAA
jgi:hypothetical protein